MKTITKRVAMATIAATSVAGLSLVVSPAANAAPTATKSFSKSFPQQCTVAPFTGTQTLGATVSGVVPTSVKHGTAFKLTNSKITTVVPASLNAQAYALGGRYQKVTFKVVNLDNTNISPATKNALTKSITTAFVAVPANASTKFTVPTTGGITVPLVAGKVGTGTLKAGSVSATYTLYNAQKQVLAGNQVVKCGATNTVLTTVKIS